MTTPEQPQAPPELLPSVDAVARVLRARTQDDMGREHDTFDDETRPTGTEVEGHIEDAYWLVALRLPAVDIIPVQFQGAIATLVAYRAALRIEKSYFPEQVRSERSPYEQLRQEYLDDLQALLDALGNAGVGVEDTTGGGSRVYSEPSPSWLSQIAQYDSETWWDDLGEGKIPGYPAMVVVQATNEPVDETRPDPLTAYAQPKQSLWPGWQPTPMPQPAPPPVEGPAEPPSDPQDGP